MTRDEIGAALEIEKSAAAIPRSNDLLSSMKSWLNLYHIWMENAIESTKPVKGKVKFTIVDYI